MAQFLLLTAISTCVYAEMIHVSELQEGGDVPVADGGVRGRHRRHLTGAYKGREWPNGRMPYIIESSVSSHDQSLIIEAIRQMTSEVGGAGCLNLERVAANTREPYVTFRTLGAPGCSSFLGKTQMAASHQHYIMLGSGCVNHGTIKHEIMHALGFIHTHQRADRDEHLNVKLGAVEEDSYSQFTKKQASEIETFGIPYDVNSIMHYADDAFSRSWPVTKTMTSNSGKILPTKNRSDLSPLDVKFVQEFYKCDETPGLTKSINVPNTSTSVRGGHSEVKDSTSMTRTGRTGRSKNVRTGRTGRSKNVREDKGCDDGKFYADPSDSSKYFWCQWGKKVTQACAGGLVWDKALGICNWA